MRRYPLSRQASLLRTSLLLSLGLSPLACGGSAVTHGSNGGDGGSDRESTAGTRDSGTAGSGHDGGYSNAAGHSNTGGTRNTGGSSGHAGTNHGGGNSSVAGGPSHGGTGGTGGAGAAGTSGHGGASGGGTIDPSECPNPVYNPSTKLTDCSNGRKHRPTAIACTYNGGGGGPSDGGGGSGGTPSTCDVDTDCSALPHGFCSRYDETQFPVCAAGCVVDEDCGGTGVCACDGLHPGHCVAAGCVTDADCGANSLCAPVDGVCGGSSFQCTSPKDQCIDRNQCIEYGCAMLGDHRACNDAICGRPFLIAERARMAAVEVRGDWLDERLTPDPSGLTPLERAQLAAHWARLGQMEHASIAAFARFNLQLLSLGAPSNLVEACNRALADETAHTRTCFALASAYGGVAVGPARLDIEHCFEETSLIAVAKLVLREGCLGETVAALEAVAAAEVATDASVKQALERIARDELNHAELAFQFLRWALSLASLEERHELACEAAQQLADFESEARNGERARTNDRLAAHGLLGSDALRAIHLAAARDVSRPLLAALFHSEESSQA